jgi:hypothetical protein
VGAVARVTLRDIAQALGVSTSTVSLALRGSDRISAPVREKVVQEASAQGYRTDLAGALLRTARPRIIGLVCDIGQELHVEYSREVVSAAEERGWSVMVEDTALGGAAAAVSRVMQLRSRSLVVVDPGSIAPEAFKGIDVPLISIGQISAAPDADLIMSNNLSGMRQLAELLSGEERVLCLDGGRSVSAERRREAFLRVMRPLGTRVRVVSSGSTMDAGWSSMHEALAKEGLKSGAVVCYNDQCALGAMAALWQKHLLVPDDVRLVGFDNSRIARSQAFELTSIDKNPREVARLAVERAVLRAEGDVSAPVFVEVDTRLVRRRTA